MSKRLKQSGAAYSRVKTNREENWTKYVGSIDKYIKKAENGRANDERFGERAE